MTTERRREWVGRAAVALAAIAGLGLIVDRALCDSATYDEVAYLRVAARWWRTGDQEAISRMGSPLTFWKLQQAPVLWALDRAGFSRVVDDPLGHQAALLPLVRIASAWIWLAALLLTAAWARLLYGPRAMALAAGLFALDPNLLAHGSLVTMELPLVAAATGMLLLFWRFLVAGDRRAFWASAALGGVAWSCKFTTALVPPILALAWWLDRRRRGGDGAARRTLRVAAGMAALVLVMGLANLVVTGFATLPLSPRTGEHPALVRRLGPVAGRLVGRLAEVPLPQDGVGFATQVRLQRSGGSSYLLGQRRPRGWWYYYLVALAVKVPLAFWALMAARAGLRGRVAPEGRDRMLPLAMGAFLVAASLGSSRNYGVRYLLPLAPLAIVWVSALAERGRWPRLLAWAGLAGMACSVAAIHPNELSYFNALAGGPAGGRRILADSNLDWGQGAKRLARLQRERPEFRELTLYAFGDTSPAHYGVVGTIHVVDAGDDHPGLPPTLRASTRYLAVSASLQFGPWGPPGYFRALDGVEPVAVLDDFTIAIYRTADLPP